MKKTYPEVIPQIIPDILLIKLNIHQDSRGYFAETFNLKKYENIIKKKINFIQDNESKSTKNVFRGFHFQIPPFEQTKLVRVIEGEVLDICIDIRVKSKTFGKGQ